MSQQNPDSTWHPNNKSPTNPAGAPRRAKFNSYTVTLTFPIAADDDMEAQEIAHEIADEIEKATFIEITSTDVEETP